MTPGRWLMIVAAAALTFLIWLGLYYRDFQIPNWAAENSAKERMIATGELATVQSMYKHVWDETAWIGLGTGESGEGKYVFLREDGSVQTVDESDIMPEEAVKAQFVANRQEANLIRMQPGLFRGSPVWEIYFAGENNGVRHHYYDFYSFDAEGRLIETYLLP